MKFAPLSTGVDPLRFVGLTTVPVAVSVQAVAAAVPALSFVTVFRKCNAGGTSLFVMVQVLVSPGLIVPEQSVEKLAV